MKLRRSERISHVECAPGSHRSHVQLGLLAERRVWPEPSRLRLDSEGGRSESTTRQTKPNQTKTRCRETAACVGSRAGQGVVLTVTAAAKCSASLPHNAAADTKVTLHGFPLRVTIEGGGKRLETIHVYGGGKNKNQWQSHRARDFFSRMTANALCSGSHSQKN